MVGCEVCYYGRLMEISVSSALRVIHDGLISTTLERHPAVGDGASTGIGNSTVPAAGA